MRRVPSVWRLIAVLAALDLLLLGYAGLVLDGAGFGHPARVERYVQPVPRNDGCDGGEIGYGGVTPC